MSTFQLDQNIDDLAVVKACNAEGHGVALRLPPSLKDALDPELLAVVMAGGCPLVTLDRRLACDHAAHIPDQNPGIVDAPGAVYTAKPDFWRHRFQTKLVALTPAIPRMRHRENRQQTTKGEVEGEGEETWMN